MDIKIIFTIFSAIFAIIGFLPYLKDVLSKKTIPHEFTWLIWAITQGTAVAALWYGGGGIGAIGLTIGTLLVILIFFLSIRDGKSNITRSDVVVLCAALMAIVIWWMLDNPLFAVLLVSAIDAIGYIPTFRKSYRQPWTETTSSWVIFTASNIFAILALQSHNFLTMTYLVTISLLNISLLIFLYLRRAMVAPPIIK